MATEGPYDLVIRGGTVFDGSGGAGMRGDVGVRGDRIVAVGVVVGRGATEIEAAGLAVTPGFVDVHSHDDLAVLMEPEYPCKVMQGVTTDIVGNCGTAVAPFAAARPMFRAIGPEVEMEPWEGYAGYLERVDEVRPSLNIAALVGHGTIRRAVLGNAERAPDAGELAQMAAYVREGMEAGAVGLSTGLIYEPGRYAATEEVIALARVLDGRGLYATHMRNEGKYLLEAVAEAIRVGEEGGVAVEISHHKVGGADNWGKVRESIKLIEVARARGLDVTADQYPYTAGSTSLFAVLQNNALNERGEEGGLGRADPANVRIAFCPANHDWEGKSIREMADLFDLPAEEAARKVVEASVRTTVVIETMDEADVRMVMAHSTTMIGSDGVPGGSKPHPRLYGTFPRVLGRYARDEGVVSLAEAVHKMTGMPAVKFGLKDRGSLRAGAFADLVVFDPATIADRATYADPCQFPAGIRAIFVNGVQVADNGLHTGARPGRALRRGM